MPQISRGPATRTSPTRWRSRTEDSHSRSNESVVSVPPSLPGGIKPVSKSEFELLRALIYRESGIFLPDTKTALLERRLTKRLIVLGLKSFGAYHRLVNSEGADVERISMLDSITTNETQFFREPRQFEFLEQTLIPALRSAADSGRRQRRLRVWSAACSTGEEPYSLAMILRHHLKPEAGWEMEILASDLSTSALARARDGVWPIETVRDIPEPFLKKFMLRGKRSQLGRIRASKELRSVIRFQRVNLHQARYPAGGPFDLIFCRNVLIYFDSKSKLGVLDRLLESLAPDGHLFVGHAESLTSLSKQVKAVVPTVYRRVRAAAERSG